LRVNILQNFEFQSLSLFNFLLISHSQQHSTTAAPCDVTLRRQPAMAMHSRRQCILRQQRTRSDNAPATRMHPRQQHTRNRNALATTTHPTTTHSAYHRKFHSSINSCSIFDLCLLFFFLLIEASQLYSLYPPHLKTLNYVIMLYFPKILMES